MAKIAKTIKAPRSFRKKAVPNKELTLLGLLTSSRTMIVSRPNVAITVNKPTKLIEYDNNPKSTGPKYRATQILTNNPTIILSIFSASTHEVLARYFLNP